METQTSSTNSSWVTNIHVHAECTLIPHALTVAHRTSWHPWLMYNSPLHVWEGPSFHLLYPSLPSSLYPAGSFIPLHHPSSHKHPVGFHSFRMSFFAFMLLVIWSEHGNHAGKLFSLLTSSAFIPLSIQSPEKCGQNANRDKPLSYSTSRSGLPLLSYVKPSVRHVNYFLLPGFTPPPFSLPHFLLLCTFRSLHMIYLLRLISLSASIRQLFYSCQLSSSYR